jgi:hypothetical protein
MEEKRMLVQHFFPTHRVENVETSDQADGKNAGTTSAGMNPITSASANATTAWASLSRHRFPSRVSRSYNRKGRGNWRKKSCARSDRHFGEKDFVNPMICSTVM